MKQETIDVLINNLNRDKKKYEDAERLNTRYNYSIEMLPVLVERDKNGRLCQVTSYENRLLFEMENKEFY